MINLAKIEFINRRRCDILQVYPLGYPNINFYNHDNVNIYLVLESC